MNMLFPIVILIILIGLLVLLFFFFRAAINNLMNSLEDDKKDGLPSVHTDTNVSVPHAQAAADGAALGTADAAKIIEAQSRQAIVFRQHFPPSFIRSLSYFGGAPTADACFNWPRWQDSEGNSRALTFIMQIDCREIPTSARLGVMPDDGVLYVFMEISEALLGSSYRVIYHAGSTDGWIEVPLLPPALSRYRCKYAMEEGQLPRVLPRWDFTPTVIEIPAKCYGEREDKDLMLFIDKLGKHFYCPLKDNRQVDDSGGTQPYRRVDALTWSATELQHGKQLKIRDFPKDYKVQCFRVEVSTHRTDFVVTNDKAQDSAEATHTVCGFRWKIEQLHREAKQVTGLESCQCRSARIHRNHIACAFLVWVRLKELATDGGRTIYQLKHGLLDDYLIQQLKQPSLKMALA